MDNLKPNSSKKTWIPTVLKNNLKKIGTKQSLGFYFFFLFCFEKQREHEKTLNLENNNSFQKTSKLCYLCFQKMFPRTILQKQESNNPNDLGNEPVLIEIIDFVVIFPFLLFYVRFRNENFLDSHFTPSFNVYHNDKMLLIRN